MRAKTPSADKMARSISKTLKSIDEIADPLKWPVSLSITPHGVTVTAAAGVQNPGDVRLLWIDWKEFYDMAMKRGKRTVLTGEAVSALRRAIRR